MLVSCGTLQQTERAPFSTPVVALAVRESLPLEARALLNKRMQRHGNDMALLMMSVLLLSDDGVSALARNIEREPTLSRVSHADDDTLNAQLPVRFFDLQDDLKTHAHELGAAADAHDRSRVMAAYMAVSQTCVSCHTEYLEGPTPEARSSTNSVMTQPK